MKMIGHQTIAVCICNKGDIGVIFLKKIAVIIFCFKKEFITICPIVNVVETV
jgi:hypothetical protein